MFFWLTALIVLVVDQFSKGLVQYLMYEGQSVPVIPHVFHLTYVRNPGAAFGLFAHRTAFFIVATLLVVAGAVAGALRLPPGHRLLRLSLGLVVGGAIGNLIDRLRFGLVVDFLDFRIWPVFNLADTAIVTGAFLLLYTLWREERERKGGEN
ncbi:signal peptidase II . Aspartic peptidase. MEROPS family A08 [Desulfofundulus australicus DSM 11792]|uniref:Lipoprotein signal peptidase n=1 Tax=Desulfofundulus australicus DSM 11792 TaxID=1121425 RepID=A0A1M5DKQ5_9FIRM|nr:signal peptidase II [Desulfofundulus australicus]SHF67494.1 signal peptidase II . Aspartic peptidase. MEROPS family A08 [Desulfofundulus australicus DSM 11792]